MTPAQNGKVESGGESHGTRLHRTPHGAAHTFANTITVIGLFLSGTSYIFHLKTIEGLATLGIPNYLRIEMAVLTLSAAVILITPRLVANMVAALLRDWAYAGSALFWLTAAIAHFANQDPMVFSVIGLLMCGTAVFARWSMPQRRS